MSQTEAAPKPSYTPISGPAESIAAIEQVISVARNSIRVFDVSLSNRGFNSPKLTESLRRLLVAGRSHRILIALHDTALLERETIDAKREWAPERQTPEVRTFAVGTIVWFTRWEMAHDGVVTCYFRDRGDAEEEPNYDIAWVWSGEHLPADLVPDAVARETETRRN